LRSSTAASESVGIDALGGVVAEHGRDLCGDQVEDVALALCLGHGGELCGERSGAPAPARGLDQGTEERRQCAGGGERAQCPSVERGREGGWGVGGEGCVEQGEALFV
jgi:hypothetical protein